MSLPPQQKGVPDKSGGRPCSAATMKETTLQHCGDVFYGGMVPPAQESAHGAREPGGHGLFNPEEGPQSRTQYQHTAPVNWMNQDPNQTPGWSQEAPGPAPTNQWGQNIGQYRAGLNNTRAPMPFPKGGHGGGAALQAGPAEKQGPGTMELNREGTGMSWGPFSASMLQAMEQRHMGVELLAHSARATPPRPSAPPGPLLQPFQFPYHTVFQGATEAASNPSYDERPKAPHPQYQLIQLQMQQQLQQQQQHQQLHQQQHQQLHQQQHLQHHQQLRQQRQQQMQHHQLQLQQQQMQRMQQQEILQPQSLHKQQPNQHFLSYNQAPDDCPPSASPPPPLKDRPCSEETRGPTPEVDTPSTDPASTPSDPCPPKVTPDPMSPSSDAPLAGPRRSRRLSRDGLSPVIGPPSLTPWNQTPRETPQNGVVTGGEGGQGPAGGVIQSTRRRRRPSKEINLETLAQKASEMESLPPAKVAKATKEEGPRGRQAGMGPLVIPVSVPVRQGQTAHPAVWPRAPAGQHTLVPPQHEHQHSVIVPRRRSLRTSLSESFSQDGESDAGQDDDGKSAKHRRRPRPEPLFIPLPKAPTFIVPSVYSAITPYQSHLRSPVRLPDHPFTLPPYTPPPILSPAREGSGLYFSTFLSSIAAGNQPLQPPPVTPKSAPRSLLHSASSDITPPAPPLVTDATPVSFEPRINIGQQYQAEVPELLPDRTLAQRDLHKAELVWLPMKESQLSPTVQETVDDLMNLACSSALNGGGTNQELALHSLHECGGNVLEALAFLLLKEPVFSKGHHLAEYHYSGSDIWTPSEKRYFNKGISAYRKDFFLVQKLVQTKSVAQCVEFYYTYKKQVKIGRSGTLTYGPPESPVETQNEALLEFKSSQRSKPTQEDDDNNDRKWEGSCDRGQDGGHLRVTQTLQAHENAIAADQDAGHRGEPPHPNPPTVPRKPRPDSAGRKSRPPPKPPQDPEGIFPCKKCTRVFYKVKSRSAHMKSHAEREKKDAALRLKEEEEREAAAAMARARELQKAVANGGEGATGEPEEVSDDDVPSDVEDENDKDWH
uniref:ELM2 and Myb/SANT-like domain containing 1b n=1 Tax=Esox lucius TaxID=8010 RepID=A0A3P9A379_ESOLU